MLLNFRTKLWIKLLFCLEVVELEVVIQVAIRLGGGGKVEDTQILYLLVTIQMVEQPIQWRWGGMVTPAPASESVVQV